MSFFYSNKKELNDSFCCVLCDEGEHGIGKAGKYVCFSCIKELVHHHDFIVKNELKIIKHL